ALDLRAQLGLSTNLTYVSELMTDPAANSSLLGIPLSASEALDVSGRPSSQDLGALNSYGAAHPATWGGLYIDQAAGGIVDIALVAGATDAGTVSSLAPTGVRIRMRTVGNSLSELQGLTAKMTALIPTLAKSGINVTQVGPEIPQNDVIVGVDPWSSAIAASLSSEFGPLVHVVEQPAATPLSCTSRAICGAPWRGGVQLTGQQNTSCTMGYVGRDSADHHYLLTASHCFVQDLRSVDWYQHGTLIGTAYNDSWFNGSQADAFAISIAASAKSNYVYVSNSEKARVITSFVSGNTVGDTVCGVGITTGESCGVVSLTGQTTTLTVFGQTVNFTNQTKAGYIGNGGDSGGTVFWHNALYGMTSADITQGVAPTWFTPVTGVITELGISPCLNLTC
ncbi:MAG: S1 family peptidase, partial [bacterium]